MNDASVKAVISTENIPPAM